MMALAFCIFAVGILVPQDEDTQAILGRLIEQLQSENA